MAAVSYTQLAKDATNLINDLGSKLVLSRADVDVAKSKGVVVQKKQNNDGSPSTTVTREQQVLIPASIKVAPEVGDYIRLKDATFYVSAVELVKPADVVLLYKADVV